MLPLMLLLLLNILLLLLLLLLLYLLLLLLKITTLVVETPFTTIATKSITTPAHDTTNATHCHATVSPPPSTSNATNFLITRGVDKWVLKKRVS